jgi:hypothetical protein
MNGLSGTHPIITGASIVLVRLLAPKGWNSVAMITVLTSFAPTFLPRL